MTQPYPDAYDVMYFEEAVMTDEWDEVIRMYNDNEYYHTLEIKGRGTALHVAVTNGEKDRVKELVSAIVMHSGENSDTTLSKLSLWNQRDATPLHIAAYRGFTSMCEYIIGRNDERKDLVKVKNENGETPLFWAVLANEKKVFAYLQQFFKEDVDIIKNKNDTTILHAAIHREMFGLAYMIMHCFHSLSSMKDKDEVTPLEVLANRTSAFKIGSQLSWWKFILYRCFPVTLKDPNIILDSYLKRINKEKDGQSGDISIQLNDVGEFETEGSIQQTLAQLDFISCAKILCYRVQKNIISLLGLDEIKTIKKNHLYGARLLNIFMENPYDSYKGGGDATLIDRDHEEEIAKKINFAELTGDLPNTTGDTSIKEREIEENHIQIDEKDKTFLAVAKIVEIMEELNSKVPTTSDKKGLLLVPITFETTYLIAAKHGIVEIMCALQSKMKSVIYELNSNDENALLLAVKYRQPHVVEMLKESLIKDIFNALSLKVDNNKNTMLHLAAYTSLETTWKISGDALQMMWDIKWYKFIKEIVPQQYKHRSNKAGKTPGEIFQEEHQELLHSSIGWLKDIADACSTIAALVAGASFATSGSIPGGTKDTGKPALQGQPAFKGFAISSLIGLYFSITALIVFLSIRTSRKEIEDFSKNLPVKLLVGLSSLFISIVAMFISFCAGNFFVLTDKYGKSGILFYLYIAICLPVTFYAVVQFPLYFDLVQVIWKKVPPPSVKGVHL